MKKYIAVITTVLALLAAFIGPASAQQQGAIDIENMKDQLDGGYMRVYTSGSGANATMEAGKPSIVAATILDYKSEDDIKGKLQDVQDGFTKQGFTREGDAQSVDGIGDEAMKSWGTMDVSGQKLDTSVVTARKGDKLLVVIVFGSKDTGLAEEVAKDMAGKDASGDPVTLKEDGTSTGGVFAMMPSTDKIDGMKDMKAMADMDMLAMIASPVASPKA